MKILYPGLIIFFVLVFLHPDLSGQTRNKLNKRTSQRHIRKEQEKASNNSDYNKFNELIPMGSRISTDRNDFIWSYETANTVPVHGGDISLIYPSRLAIGSGMEIGTSIASIPFIPTIFVKKRWVKDKILISTRHQVYSYSPMFNFLQNHDSYTLISSDIEIPQVLALKNELILSKAFLKELKCGGVKQPFLILTGAIAYDYGFTLKESKDSVDYNYKLLNPRKGVVLGDNGFFQVLLQGDLYLSKKMYLTVAARGILPSAEYNHAIEQNSSLKFMLSPKFSANFGYWLTFGKGNGSFILPTLDLTFHFGQKELREKGLFGKM